MGNGCLMELEREIPKWRVFVLCGNRLLRESIARILGKKTDFDVIAAQGISIESAKAVGESAADVLVLDSFDFLSADPAWSAETLILNRSLKCVLVAMEDDHSRFLTAVRRGARGYVLQDASAADVVSAVRAVADGDVACPPRYTGILFDYISRQSEQLPNRQKREKLGLTRREQQLVPLIGRGLSNKEIANQLSLSEQTIKNHIHRILRKVGVSDRLSIFEACHEDCAFSSTNSVQG